MSEDRLYTIDDINSLKSILKYGHCDGLPACNGCFFYGKDDLCDVIYPPYNPHSPLRNRVIAIKYLTELGVDIEESVHESK